jgi:hypothetical protein
MKFTSSFTDIDGVTSSFSVEPSLTALSLSLSGEESSASSDDLSESFEQSLPGMLQAHLQAHRAASRSLGEASLAVLKKNVTAAKVELEATLNNPTQG